MDCFDACLFTLFCEMFAPKNDNNHQSMETARDTKVGCEIVHEQFVPEPLGIHVIVTRILSSPQQFIKTITLLKYLFIRVKAYHNL